MRYPIAQAITSVIDTLRPWFTTSVRFTLTEPGPGRLSWRLLHRQADGMDFGVAANDDGDSAA